MQQTPLEKMALCTTAMRSTTTRTDEHSELRQSLNIMSLIVYCLAFVLGVLGNGVVIWVTGFKMKKTVNTVWFLNLAVADFLFTAFLPLSVTYTAMDFHWPFGKFMCKLNSTMSFLNMFASVYILVVISVDRCVSVVWPVWAQNHRSVRKASCVSLGVWVLALILSAPYFIFRDTGPSYNNEDIINCFNNFAFSDDYETPSVNQLRLFRHQAMTITRFLLGFVVPFTVIVSCYAVIIHRLRRNRTLASHSSRPFKIIAAVITTFFLCWAPYHIMALIELVNHMATHSSEILDHVTTIGVPIATSLAFLNSCLNPLLYVFMGQDFKDKVRKSILNVLETAFQEEVSRSYTYTNSVVTSRSKEKSVSDAEVSMMKMNATPPSHNNATNASENNEFEFIDEYAELRKALNTMTLVIFCLAFILGMFGNGVVIWVTGFKMKKTVNTVWFLNLAVADFLFTSFLPLSVTYLALNFHWPFGKLMCKLTSTLSSLNIFASVYILMAISVDRCVSVVWPVWAQNHRNVRKASCVSLGVWVLALILSAPYFIFRDTAPSLIDEKVIICFNNFSLSGDETSSVNELQQFRYRAVTITRSLLGFVVPFTVIVSCYAVIIHRVRRNRTLASQSGRAFKIIAAVITAFFLCWAPFHIMILTEMVNYMSVPPSETLDYVTTIGVPIATSLAFLNSCLNPLLYVFMGQDFKDKIRKSILNVFETAFQEDVTGSHTDKTVTTGQSKDKSINSTEL
ncbi:hypothetical protein L3Q82_013114 [Scortum barcoo]|uniref:Uncharacterized protein n=1 Tax=Scortum barcoo TaxID=214431 RepID=A0ACB8VZD2_9TELE|nr:hypothetical protein L3Q82_013114 [Scortum barcoo]